MNSAGKLGPGRLWSLQDIMRPFRVTVFLQVVDILGMLSTAEHVPALYKRLNELSNSVAMLKGEQSEHQSSYVECLSGFLSLMTTDDEISAEHIRQGVELFSSLEVDCEDLGLNASAATARKITMLFRSRNGNHINLVLLSKELRGRLIDEMGGGLFWALDLREARYYRRYSDHWGRIISRFPVITRDVEEACKCFALSRYAASVFHSVQITEAGLIELGKFLSVCDPLSGWTAVSKALTKTIAKSYNEMSQFERDNFLFLEQVQATVMSLKNAWRNKISHSQGKLTVMTADFSPDIAEEIIIGTRAFMGRLVDGLPT